MLSPSSRPGRLARRLLLIAGSLGLALLLGEGLLRLCLPAALFVQGRDTEGWTENTPTFDAFMRIDASLGYVPLPGTQLYGENGLYRDQPRDLALPSGDMTVLWLGDSVTARRFIEREVRKRSAVPFASWCGGVEGYNAAQSLGYYRRVLADLQPQHVVFTLHHNDWWNTPVVFYDDEGKVHCRTLDHEVAAFSPWLFQYSYLYRMVFSWSTSAAALHDGAVADQKVKDTLRGLRDTAAADALPLTVMLLPPMLAEAKWSAADLQRHAAGLDMLRELGIRHVDLLPGLRRALAAGVDPQQMPNDWMHPSEEVAKFFAEDLLAAGFAPGR